LRGTINNRKRSAPRQALHQKLSPQASQSNPHARFAGSLVQRVAEFLAPQLIRAALAGAFGSTKREWRNRSGTCRAIAFCKVMVLRSGAYAPRRRTGHSGRAASTGCFGSTTSAGIALVAADRATIVAASATDCCFASHAAAAGIGTRVTAAAGLAGAAAAAGLAGAAAAAGLARCASRRAGRVVVASTSNKRYARAQRDDSEQAS
jgi:hypothetical protein